MNSGRLGCWFMLVGVYKPQVFSLHPLIENLSQATSPEVPTSQPTITAAIMVKPLKLLRGGTVLIPVESGSDHISPRVADILIDGDRISKIESSIPPPTGCDIIDCMDKIISPGFIDTHHHVWQSPLKGFFGNTALFPYLAIG